MSSYQVVEGVVNFSNLTKTDTYLGKDTGKFNITITMSEEDATRLQGMGVKIKDYEGNKQRKFATQYTVKVIDSNDKPFSGEVPYDSKVRVLFKLGNEHPVHGVSTYLNGVRVLELPEFTEENQDDSSLNDKVPF